MAGASPTASVSANTTANASIQVAPASAASVTATASAKHQEYLNSSPLAGVYPAPLFEYFFDSARTVIDLIMSGTFVRFRRIRWIVSHCGNVLPDLLDRL